MILAIFCGEVSPLAPLNSQVGEQEELQPSQPMTFFQHEEEFAWQLSIFPLL